jgi:hypothetical protein
MENGTYKTDKGSSVIISGKHGGISHVEFDWLEEGGCCECKAEAYPLDGCLVWNCAECGGGSAKLHLSQKSELAQPRKESRDETS